MTVRPDVNKMFCMYERGNRNNGRVRGAVLQGSNYIFGATILAFSGLAGIKSRPRLSRSTGF